MTTIEDIERVRKLASQTIDGLAVRLAEREEYISLAIDEAHDSLYTYYEVRGPTQLVNQQIDQLLIRWHPSGYGTTVTRRARSSDGHYQIAIVRRANSCD